MAGIRGDLVRNDDDGQNWDFIKLCDVLGSWIRSKRLYVRNKTNSHLKVSTHTYNTRSQSSFINPSFKGNIYVNSFFPRTIKDWNTLALNIRKIETLDIFKRTIWEQILFI